MKTLKITYQCNCGYWDCYEDEKMFYEDLIFTCPGCKGEGIIENISSINIDNKEIYNETEKIRKIYH